MTLKWFRAELDLSLSSYNSGSTFGNTEQKINKWEHVVISEGGRVNKSVSYVLKMHTTTQEKRQNSMDPLYNAHR